MIINLRVVAEKDEKIGEAVTRIFSRATVVQNCEPEILLAIPAVTKLTGRMNHEHEVRAVDLVMRVYADAAHRITEFK
jgi:hypothetical protein